jgi:hypothetical protein
VIDNPVKKQDQDPYASYQQDMNEQDQEGSENIFINRVFGLLIHASVKLFH